jgi:hypothetical protein
MGGLQKTKTPARMPAPLKEPTRLPIHYCTLEDTFCQEHNEEGFQNLQGLEQERKRSVALFVAHIPFPSWIITLTRSWLDE